MIFPVDRAVAAARHEGGNTMRTPRIVRSVTVRGRRGIVLFVTGALAMCIGFAGVRALASDPPKKHVAAEGPATAPVAPPAVTDLSPSVAPTQPSPSTEPAPDPNALADGVYPTFVRAVDVQGAEITVDVLQVFVGEAEQHQAAIEDGVEWEYFKYDPVYVRNENPLLRQLPVAWDVRILFYGWCDYPSRWAGLTEVRKEAASSGEGWYYEITVVDGEVVGIEQKVASSGC
jgi:hypothetical protein